MSELQDLIANHTIKAYNQGFNDAIGKHKEILELHKEGMLKISALALQEGIKAERKRIVEIIQGNLSHLSNNELIAKICEDQPCDDCESDCCGRL